MSLVTNVSCVTRGISSNGFGRIVPNTATAPPLARQGAGVPPYLGTWDLDGHRHRPGVAQGSGRRRCAPVSGVTPAPSGPPAGPPQPSPATALAWSRISWDTSLAAEATRSRSHWSVPAGAVKRARPGYKACPFAAERTYGPDSTGLLAPLGSYGAKDPTGLWRSLRIPGRFHRASDLSFSGLSPHRSARIAV